MSLWPSLPRSVWVAIIKKTLLRTGLATFLSYAFAEILLGYYSQGLDATGMLAAILIPICLGGPTLFYAQLKHEELLLAHQRLRVLADTDRLTECLNHGAFAAKVEALLGHDEAEKVRGALLVIDADHFKAINDRFGHDRGDIALQLISSHIRAALRERDIVGRLGGEEFGVYLPGAGQTIALRVADRIRKAIYATEYEVNGVVMPLSVSIGVAIHYGPMGFPALFRAADDQLYIVKNAGRNRVDHVVIDLLTAAEPAARSA